MDDEDDRRIVRPEAEGAVPEEDQAVTSDSERRPADGKKAKKQGSFWKELPILIGVALVLALVIKAFAVQAFYIPSGSMENTLQIGDRVLVNKIVYHTRDIKRGDIVVFNGLDSWDPETEVQEPSNPVARLLRLIGSAFGVAPTEKDYIKRVIGIPGDRVKCCDAKGRVTVNGVPLNENPYLFTDPVTGERNKASDDPFDVTVRPGQLWVMGDHRELSYDSRSHRGDPGGGTIPTNRVIGRAFVIVWPVNRADTLPIPGTFEQRALTAASAALPATPLALGLMGAVPITYLNRRLRLRLGRR
jgi:signal peptidase I